MPLINADTARAASRNFRAIFYSALGASNVSWYRDLFMVIQSNTPEETISFLRGTPRMREWLGDRQIRNLAEASFKLEKKDWESTISVLRDQIIYDRLNQVRPAIESLGQSFPLHYVDFAIDLMLAGFTTNGYDGQFFFDTDHDNGGGASYSNRTADVFSSAAWAAVKSRPSTLRDPENTRYLGVRYDTIVAGSLAEAAIDTVFGTQRLANGQDNIYYNNIRPERRIIVPELGNTAKWFAFDLSKPIKPFILMIVKGVDFVALDGPTDWNVFNKKEYIYGIDSIDNASYAMWELAFGSTAGE